MTIGELINRVQFIFNQGVNTDDNPVSNQLIYNKIKTYRSTLVRQMINSNQYIGNNYYQNIVVDLKPVIYNGMRVLYSDSIPRFCVSNYLQAIQYVYNDGIKLDVINPNRAKYFRSGSKYVNNKPTCFFDRDQVYIINNILMKHINISAIFEDVIDAYRYNNNNLYDYMSLDACIGDSIADSIIKLCISDINGSQEKNQQQGEE